MQQRRGLKQDLPKPLRPGEIGFATDSRQIYIGADTVDPVSDVYNKTGIFEKTSSAQSTTASIANVQMIKFTVPHKIYDKGEFDGVTDSINWTPTSNVALTSTPTEYSRLNDVFGTTVQNFKNVLTGNVFVPTDLFVVKEGTTLAPSNVATIASGNDYFFAQTGNLSLNNHSHELTFRTPPSGAEAVSISYYGNSAIINAISNTTIGTSGVAGFYTAKGISSYRQLDEKNIRVTPGSGIGFIGMQFKHIQVATDIKVAPVDADVSSAGVLGNLFLTKNDSVDVNLTATYNAGNATISVSGSITPDSYSANGVHNHVFIAGGSDWLNNKVLKVNSYDSANAQLVAELPANTASLTRKIDSISEISSNVQIQLPSIQDTEVGDSIYFWEPANTSQLHQLEASITAINPLSNTVDLDLLYTAVANANVDVYAMVFKDGDNSNVVVNSDRHALETGYTVSLASSGSGLGSFAVETTGNINTFIIDYGTSITSNITDLTFTPLVSSATVSATPVTTFDLSSAGSVSDTKTIVNSFNLWPKLNNVPGAPNKLYITHAEAVVKTPFSFSLHNDQSDTLTALGLSDGEYTRQNATVKAKLEDWLDTTRDNTQLNIFKEIYSNQEFFGANFTTWNLNIDSALGEMNFETRTEARDFSQILNNLYFESVNPDIRGLMNIKTNIEFLTTEALAAGSATTSFTSPEQITIQAGGPNVVSELGLSLNDDYQTMVVEYSMQGGTASNTYRRVGTLMYSGDPLAGDVVFNDNYSDLSNGMTGNVVFSANVSGANQLAVSVTNTLSPSTDLSMRYIVRRWGDA